MPTDKDATQTDPAVPKKKRKLCSSASSSEHVLTARLVSRDEDEKEEFYDMFSSLAKSFRGCTRTHMKNKADEILVCVHFDSKEHLAAFTEDLRSDEAKQDVKQKAWNSKAYLAHTIKDGLVVEPRPRRRATKPPKSRKPSAIGKGR